MRALVFLAVAAWSLQALLALVQFRRFQSKLSGLSGRYNIGIGHWKSRFGFGAIVIVCADAAGTIESVEFMQGVTVFARFKKLKGYGGRNIYGEFDVKGSNEILAKAFEAAIANTRKIMGGEKAVENIGGAQS